MVPGVTSAIAVPALAGVPVTHRAVNHEFVVVSGHVAPDHPESLVNWNALAALSGTIVLLMAVERIELFADALLAGRPTCGYAGAGGPARAPRPRSGWFAPTLAEAAETHPRGGYPTARDHRDRAGRWWSFGLSLNPALKLFLILL